MTIYGVVAVCLLVAYSILLVFYLAFSYADGKSGYCNNEVFELKCIVSLLISTLQIVILGFLIYVKYNNFPIFYE